MTSLTLLFLLPVVGVVLLGCLPAGRARLIRGLAIACSGLTLLAAFGLLVRFDPGQSGLQFLAKTPWQPRLGSYFALGVDGISLPMVLLAALLCLVALLASGGIRERVKGYYVSMLFLEGAMLGVFMAQDWSMFYVFWELTLLPLFFLINSYGGPNRSHAALNFVLYTMGGSVFLLISLLLSFDQAASHTFLMGELAAGLWGLPRETQVWIFLGFLIGFGVKMPIFPLHGWLPLAHVEAPSPVSILLSGVLLKMGSYGLIRVTAMLPDAVVALQGPLVTLALVNLLYGGVLAWRQSDLKVMIAYSSISHMGVVVLGIAALNQAGITGAMMQMVSHGLVAGLLFLLVGLLYQRTHTRELGDYGSLVATAPRFAFFLALALVGSVGLPGTSGFVAELHALVGGWQRWGWLAALLGVGMMVGAAYAVRTISRLCTGPGQVGSVVDLGRLELTAVGLLAGGMVALGVAPAYALELMGATLGRFSGVFAGRM